MSVKIFSVSKNGICGKKGIRPGDQLLTINSHEINDVLDYRFYSIGEKTEMVFLCRDNRKVVLKLRDQKAYDKLGISFETFLMDKHRHCKNSCIFCFIDQNPRGMRETVYFKDDDSRLSFLMGNYITLTNMTQKDIDRIIKMRMSPINVSVHTTNPELRCKMLNNRFAGEALKKVDKFMEAGILMNGQIVLCKGVNDGDELEFSIREMAKYLPNLQSVSVVPVGLSKYREGLYPLSPFTKEDACQVIDTIEKWQQKIYAEYGLHFIHASDEWYILAERELPEEDRYDGYLQLENGVGMLRLLHEEFEDALNQKTKVNPAEEKITLATGKLAYPTIKAMAEAIMQRYPQLDIRVYAITNHFFGEMITVSGLLTGQDILAQLKDMDLGDRLLLPVNVLRSGEEVFLDDMTLTDLEKALQVKIDIVKSSGYDFVDMLLNNAEK